LIHPLPWEFILHLLSNADPLLGFLQVVLAANDMPSINDITYEELVQVISKVFF
jgi:hypothetical protein